MSRRVTVLQATTLLTLMTTPALAQGGPAPSAAAEPSSYGVPAEEVAAVRAATEKYRDVAVALADGYVAHPMCMEAGMEGQPRQLGAMGYHYFRPDLLGLTVTDPRVEGTGIHTDFARPGVLLYEPRADGSLQLTGIENLVWAKAWREAGNEGPPEYHGNQYYLTIDNPATEIDEAHGFEPHFELHWWLYRENSAGEFSPFNRAVSCEHGTTEHAAH